MTLLDQHTPVLRNFSPARMALIALTSDGLTLIRRMEDEDWKIAARLFKPTPPLLRAAQRPS
ncbi:MAG: hypothetical protein L0Y57_02630 [Beijerinckiaceae bacterium]|nr:hypothetical protein [Beijerinckiaceae bacterium]MCI0598202.1 hypothetical protein [Beijerinckiaceae bacterium]